MEGSAASTGECAVLAWTRTRARGSPAGRVIRWLHARRVAYACTWHPRPSCAADAPAAAPAAAAADDACGKDSTSALDYSVGLHIGSVFILLAVSLLGSLLPVALHISSKSTLVLTLVKLGTFFGFGTILATAFIHMLSPAAQNLSSPCLPASWNDLYDSWAYLFVVVAIMVMQLIDFCIEGAYQRYCVSAGACGDPQQQQQQQQQRVGKQPHTPACHEQAHDADVHTHHAVVVGAMASLHQTRRPLDEGGGEAQQQQQQQQRGSSSGGDLSHHHHHQQQGDIGVGDLEGGLSRVHSSSEDVDDDGGECQRMGACLPAGPPACPPFCPPACPSEPPVPVELLA